LVNIKLKGNRGPPSAIWKKFCGERVRENNSDQKRRKEDVNYFKELEKEGGAFIAKKNIGETGWC